MRHLSLLSALSLGACTLETSPELGPASPIEEQHDAPRAPATVVAQIASEQHQLQQHGDLLRLVNPHTDLEVRVLGSTTELAVRHGDDPARASLQTVTVRRGDALVDTRAGVGRVGACDPSDVRTDVEGDCLHRAEVVSGPVTAWWDNPASAPRQGWTVDALGTTGDLRIDVAVAGLPVSIEAGALVVGAGAGALRGENLRAWDARGADLAVTPMATDDGFALVVDVDGAAWPVTVDPSWVPGVATFQADATNAAFGASLAICDVDGDGNGDLVVGSSLFDGGSTDGGRVYVYYGPALTTVVTIDGGLGTTKQFGAAVACGDYNADDLDDLAVGVPNHDNGQTDEGAVYVFAGNGTRTYGTANFIYETNTASDTFGTSLAWGRTAATSGAAVDLIVGCPTCDVTASNNQGKVFVFSPTSGSLPASGAAASQATKVLNGAEAGARNGQRVIAVDLNNDGYEDLVTGVPLANGTGGTDSGVLRVYPGSSTGTATGTTSILANGTANTGYLGSALAKGDFNGDGIADLVAGARATGTGGEVWLIHGVSGSMPSTIAQKWSAGQAGANFGVSIAVGDVDDDGLDDVVAAGDLYDGASSNMGQVRVFMGRVTAPTTADATYEGDSASLAMGFAVAVGSVQSTGIPQVFASAHLGSSGQTAEGIVVQLDLQPQLDADDDGFFVNTDCDDASASVGESVTAYADNDGDTYGATSAVVCPLAGGALPSPYVAASGDCNDASSLVYPGASDPVGSGVDRNCDSTIQCYANADGDAARTADVITGIAGCLGAGQALSTLPPGDCADGNAAIFPGATEIVDDGIDQDCTGGDMCYADQDGDGYRTIQLVPSSDLSCVGAGEAGTATPAGDCDDALSTVYPNAAEPIANGRDDDCNGTELCWRDDDGDGASAGGVVTSIDPDCLDVGETPTSPPPADCDDNNLAFFPGANDIPGNGLDEDCSGADAELGSGADPCDGGAGPIAGAEGVDQDDFTVTSITARDAVGSAMVVGDFNDDGVDDLAVGAPGDDTNGVEAGAVYLFWGPVSAPDLDAASADVILLGEAPYHRSGSALANAGDIDNDGADDLLIGGATGGASTAKGGIAHLVVSSTLVSNGVVDLLTEATARFVSNTLGDRLGFVVSAAGDLDGDLVDDLLITAPIANSTGEVYAYYGPITGTQTPATADVVFRGLLAGARFGWAATGIGDYDGDGIGDIAVGAPFQATGGKDSGAVYVFAGDASLPGVVTGTSAITTLYGGIRQKAGATLAPAGNLVGSTAADFWSASVDFGAKSGAVYLIAGGSITGTLPLEAGYAHRLTGTGADDLAGSAVVGNIDFDDDGSLDVLVGGPRATGLATQSGAAWVAYGPFEEAGITYLRTEPGYGQLDGVAYRDITGTAVAAGDLDDDGFADAVVGSPSATGGALASGVVNIHRGGNDPANLTTYFRDADGDGFGDASSSATFCSEVAGYVANDDDCNDAPAGGASFYPAAPEACLGGVDFNCDGQVGDVDHDGDGVTACGGDCNDADDAVLPGADDLCFDGVDNDCNGEVDGSTATDALNYYGDADGDGYGNRGTPLRACEPPFEGLLLVGGDCADLQVAINPAALELCDGVDNDCDDAIDEPSADDAPIWYRDGDGDLAGDPFRSTRACVAPSLNEGGSFVDYVGDGTDCDDGDAAIYPAAPEVCDGVDNDCDGTFYLGGSFNRSAYDFTTLQGGRVGDQLGSVIGVLGDQDLDGDSEILLGFPAANDGAAGGGMVLIVRGAEAAGNHVVQPGRLSGGTWSIRLLPTRQGTALGSSFASGDLNGDGIADLAVGAPGARVPNANQGAVYIFFGPLTDGTRTTDGANVVVRGSAGNASAGSAVAIGDVNGDGYGDLVVGEPGHADSQGAAYVIYGTDTPLWQGSIALAGATRLTGGDNKDRLGSALAVADVDGDGFADVFAGAPNALTLNQGQVLGWFGAGTPFSGTPAPGVAIAGQSTNDLFGAALAGLGDVNGDTRSDLAVGSPFNGAHVLLSSATRWVSGNVTTLAGTHFLGRIASRAGSVVSAPGDVNGDGLADLALGAPDDDTAGRNYGAVYIIYGRTDFDDVVSPGTSFDLNTLETYGTAGATPSATVSAGNAAVYEGARIYGLFEDDVFGKAIAAGDVTGDGFAELLVGMPNTTAAGITDAGSLVVFRGGEYGTDLGAVDMTTYWWDRDGDSWTEGVSFQSCPMHVPAPGGVPQAYATRTRADDCVDSDETIHPCADELDGDAIDSNCDGSNDRVADFDGDGLSFGTEDFYGTCTELADTDGDGEDDDEEIYRGSDPLDPFDYILGSDDLVAGDLLVTEIMINPDACSDTAGEYGEILNTLSVRVDIGGVTFFDNTGSTLLSGGPFVLAPGERVVIAQSVPQFAGCYPGLGAYAQSGFAFGNSGDSFGVRVGSTVINEVDFNAWTIVGGFSYELDDGDGTTWCLADALTPSGDRGSPGAANGICGASSIAGLDDLNPGELLITEVMADPDLCPDDQGEYVEVLYSGAVNLDLTGLTFVDASGNTAVLGPVIAGPGDRLIFARVGTSFQTCYGFAPDGQFTFGLDNTGGDLVRLTDGTNTLDEVDYRPWTVTPGVAFERDDAVASRWCLAVDAIPSSGDIGTPLVLNGSCVVDDFDGDGVTDAAESCLGIDPFLYDSDDDGAGDGVEIAAGHNPHGVGVNSSADEDGDGLTDADEALAGTDPWSNDSDGDGLLDGEEGAEGTGICLADTDSDGAPDGVEVDNGFDPTDPLDHPTLAADLVAGDVTVNEFIADPSGLCDDTNGEYIELKYNGAQIAVLDGLTITDALPNSYTISGSVVVAPGGLVVIARSGTFPDCYGFAPAGVSNLALDNAGDSLTITVGATPISSLTYTSGNVVAGRSRERDDANANNFCVGDDLTANGQLGTPGTANGVCPVTVPGVDTLGAGSLQVTELMINPGACGGDDNLYEYFEVLYTGTGSVDLQGLQIADGASSITLGTSLVMNAGERAVFARTTTEFTACYGITPDAVFTQSLNNTGDSITLSNAGGVIDSANLIGFAVTAGSAWELSEPFETPDRWCLGDAAIGATADLGTPGTTNDACPVLPDPPSVIITELNHYNVSKPQNNYLELFNAGGSDADMTDYAIRIYSNGSTTVSQTIALSGTLPAGETYILAYRTNPIWYLAGITNPPDHTSTNLLFNGDDAVALAYNSSNVDVFGVIGVQPSPSTSWNHLNTVVIRGCHAYQPSTSFVLSDWGVQSSYLLGTLDAYVPCPEGDWTGDFDGTFNVGGTDYACPGTITFTTDAAAQTISGSLSCTAADPGTTPVTATVTAQYDPFLYGLGNAAIGGTTAWGGGIRKPGASGNPGPSEIYGAFTGHLFGGIGQLSGDWAIIPAP